MSQLPLPTSSPVSNTLTHLSHIKQSYNPVPLSNKLGPIHINAIIHNFFKYIIILKMFHFQTKLYKSHKISDTYLTTLLEQFDKFMEVLQGHNNQQISTSSITLDIQMADDNTILNVVHKFIKYMRKIKGIYNDEIDTIVDEIVMDTLKFKYLLLFK